MQLLLERSQVPCINSLEPGLLRKKRAADYGGILGGPRGCTALSFPCCSLPVCNHSLPVAPETGQAPVGASAPEGQRLGVPPAPQPPTAPSPSRRLCVSETSAASSLRTPSCHQGRWIRAAPSPPGAAQREHGAAQHIWSSWKGRASAGFRAFPAGCGWSA